MTIEQATVFAILGATLALFVWGRWRYDVVAMLALFASLATGVLPMNRAFEGFANPAVVTVAAVLVISRALQQAGLVDFIVRLMAPVRGRPLAQLIVMTSIVTLLSSVMNNVGALALMLPVALRQAYRDGYSPAIVLMPLAFGSLLGGMTTLIGTPPNILVSEFRAREVGEPFGMFDFSPVGVAVAITGVAFMTLVGWRLIPKNRRADPDPNKLFDIASYVTELMVPLESTFAGMTVRDIGEIGAGGVQVLGIVRDERRKLVPMPHEVIKPGDLLIVEGDATAIEDLMGASDLRLAVDVKKLSADDLRDDEIALSEVIVPPGSKLQGKTVISARLRTVNGVNLVAIARHGRRLTDRIAETAIESGDVLLLQGPRQRLANLRLEYGLLPLAERDIKVSKPRKLALTAGIFAVAIAAVTVGLLPAEVAFAAAAVLLTVLGVLGRDEPYTAINWPIIVLIAALIPVGSTLETSGGTALIANAVLGLTGGLSPVWVLVLLMLVTMALTDVINNAATVVLMAPLAIGLAERLDVSVDPLLMGVGVAASCAFLTPIGHQSATLVMKPGGYRFQDYWRLGLPLEILVLLVSVPLLLIVFPW